MLTTCSCAQKAQLEYIFKDNMVREVGKCKVHEVFQREKEENQGPEPGGATLRECYQPKG